MSICPASRRRAAPILFTSKNELRKTELRNVRAASWDTERRFTPEVGSISVEISRKQAISDRKPRKVKARAHINMWAGVLLVR